MKSIIIKSLVIVTAIILGVIGYLNKNYNNKYVLEEGEIFGTYYSIEYQSHANYSKQIDSIFNRIDAAVSYYKEDSELNNFNKNGYLRNPSNIFLQQLKSSEKYFEQTNGAFEPTITPLIEIWGFGFDERKKVDSKQIDSLLSFVSLKNNIIFNDTMVTALRKNTTLNLTALGEGYTLNKIAEFLEKEGIDNYKVEIGGEVKCLGRNRKGEIWKIGIENPYFSMGKEEDRFIYITELNNTAISTSGSYRKFYVDSTGKRRPHIIDPKTGYPVDHTLLSASIKCPDAEKADALATACMVLGHEKAIELIQNDNEVEGFLMYDDESRSISVWKSEGF